MNGKDIILLSIILGVAAICGYYLGYHAGFSSKDPKALDNLSPVMNNILSHHRESLSYA
jgi:hypothetical protein